MAYSCCIEFLCNNYEKMNERNKAFLYLLVTFFAWGSLYVVSKFVLGKVPVITIIFIRYFIAGVSLFILNIHKNKKIHSCDYKYIFVIGAIGYFISVSAQLIGIKFSNASIASLVNSMNPIMIMIFASLFLKEKLTSKKVICVIMAVTGAGIIIGDVKNSGQNIGIIFSIISVILWSIISIVTKKMTEKYESSIVTMYCMFVAAACTLPVSIYEVNMTEYLNFDITAVTALLYMGIFCTALAYMFWNKSLSILEAGTCSLFYPFQPIVSTVLGIVFLGERINVNFIVGAAIILSAVFFSVFSKKKNLQTESV